MIRRYVPQSKRRGSNVSTKCQVASLVCSGSSVGFYLIVGLSKESGGGAAERWEDRRVREMGGWRQDSDRLCQGNFRFQTLMSCVVKPGECSSFNEPGQLFPDKPTLSEIFITHDLYINNTVCNLKEICRFLEVGLKIPSSVSLRVLGRCDVHHHPRHLPV